MKTKLLLSLLMLGMGVAQHSVSGTVKDAETKEALIGANVIVKGTTIGAATDMDGLYELELQGGNYTLQAMYVGYVNSEKKVNVNKNLSVDFDLKSDVFSREVIVTAERAKFRETPVAFKDIDAIQIQNQVATQDVSMLLNSVPGVYASEQGGGSGDSRINIRGFSTENIAVMINGVPVNDMENGWVYWSNWSGLGDVTENMQVQRGLGANKLSASSVGGSVNIITKSTDSEQKGLFKTSIGDYNTKKALFAYSTGLMENNMAFSAMVSRKTSDGYADETWSEDMTYFASLGMILDDHSLNLNVVGTPQKHGQRIYKQTRKTWNKLGETSNMRGWGRLNGEKVSIRENFYHKPVIDLNHVFQIDEKTSLNNVLYASFGSGGGKGTLGAYLDDLDDGSSDIQKAYDENVAGGGASKTIHRASRNNHSWYGLISSYDKKLDNGLNLTFGIDGRYYVGEHYRTVEDLWGGTHWEHSNSLYDPVTNEKTGEKRRFNAKVGDKIAYNNDGIVVQYGTFAQVEKKMEDATFFTNMSLYNKGYKRRDYFTYATTQTTDFENFIGGHLKAGLNYNINKESNVFINAGYLSIAPGFDAVYINYKNQLNENVKNETVYSAELGYGFSSNKFALNANTYYTVWKDRYYSTDTKINDIEYDVNFFDGVTQNHYGIEIDGKYKPFEFLELDGSLAIAKNTFTDNFTASVFDKKTNDKMGEVSLYIKDLYIPDQPMKTLNFGVNFKKNFGEHNFFINPRMHFVDEHYAAYDIVKYNSVSSEGEQSYKIPTYSKWDLTAGMNFNFEQLPEFSIIANFFNLLDEKYVTDADGNDYDSAKIYYSRPRSWSIGLNVNF